MSSSDYAEVAARFARETARHEMRVLHDQGLYRHLRFSSRPDGYSEYWFDLITVPGALIVQGDGETFAFRRAEDMFEFFRSGIWPDGSRHINPGYWSEKLTSDRDSVMTYSSGLFEQAVADDLRAAEPIYPGVTAAWAEHVGEWSEYDTDYEDAALRAADDFEFDVKYKAACSGCGDGAVYEEHFDAVRWGERHRADEGSKHDVSVEKLGFCFSDTREWRLRDFDWWFLWACHAIVWGIGRYDAARGQVAA